MRSVARPAVIFGGPSPEHDISILTGLQAARALADAGQDPLAIYWSKAGDFHLVPAHARGEGLRDRRARQGRAARPGGPAGRRLRGRARAGSASASPLELSRRRELLPRWAGRGRQPAGRARPGRRALHRARRPRAPRWGWTSWPSAASWRPPGCRRCPARRCQPADGPDPAFAGPYIVKPRFGGSSIGIEITDDLGAARALVRTSPHYRDGAVVEPYLPDLGRPERVGAVVAGAARCRPSRSRCAAEHGGPHLHLRREVPRRRRGPVVGAPRAARGAARRRGRAGCGPWPCRSRRLALVRGAPRIDFLWHGDDLWVNEINTIPGAMAWYFWQAGGCAVRQLLADLLDEADPRTGPGPPHGRRRRRRPPRRRLHRRQARLSRRSDAVPRASRVSSRSGYAVPAC